MPIQIDLTVFNTTVAYPALWLWSCRRWTCDSELDAAVNAGQAIPNISSYAGPRRTWRSSWGRRTGVRTAPRRHPRRR